MEAEAVIYREDVAAMLFAVAGMNVNIRAIRQVLEGEDGGEEALPEDDA